MTNRVLARSCGNRCQRGDKARRNAITARCSQATRRPDNSPPMQTKPLPLHPIVILISGGGSNMAAIVRAAAQQRWAERFGARITAVISNTAEAGGLAWAQQQGLATAVVKHQDFASREAFDAVLARAIDAYAPSLVVLAGFMRILTPDFVARYDGRLLNIHPSLLPAFPGLHTHQRAIEAGCKVAGVTVHQVTAQLDRGSILAQAAVPVLADDTAQSLAARVLTQEHLLYPQAVQTWLAAATGTTA